MQDKVKEGIELKFKILDKYHNVRGGNELKYSNDVVTCNIAFSAMDEFAEQVSIEFSEWIKKWYSISKGKYRHRGDFYKNDKKLYTTKELYTLFKNKS